MLVDERTIENPLDVFEDLAAERPWLCQRNASDQLQLSLSGVWVDYDLALDWYQPMRCVHLVALFGAAVPTASAASDRRDTLLALLAHINAQLWFGFFSLDQSGHIVYRHSHLFTDGASAAACEVLVEVARAALDRWQIAFELAQHGRSLAESLQAACVAGHA